VRIAVIPGDGIGQDVTTEAVKILHAVSDVVGRALYRKHGFVECAPFGGYLPDPNSVFMSLDLGKPWTR
jgi:isocitrate/isopropylmalate dehydrogenase